jgi:hypothetical protein
MNRGEIIAVRGKKSTSPFATQHKKERQKVELDREKWYKQRTARP